MIPVGLCLPVICHEVVPGLEFSAITQEASTPSGPSNVEFADVEVPGVEAGW
jgi:hypothetical protein